MLRGTQVKLELDVRREWRAGGGAVGPINTLAAIEAAILAAAEMSLPQPPLLRLLAPRAARICGDGICSPDELSMAAAPPPARAELDNAFDNTDSADGDAALATTCAADCPLNGVCPSPPATRVGPPPVVRTPSLRRCPTAARRILRHCAEITTACSRGAGHVLSLCCSRARTAASATA